MQSHNYMHMPTIETGQLTQPTTMSTSVIATVFENHGYVSKFMDIWVFSFKIYILSFLGLLDFRVRRNLSKNSCAKKLALIREGAHSHGFRLRLQVDYCSPLVTLAPEVDVFGDLNKEYDTGESMWLVFGNQTLLKHSHVDESPKYNRQVCISKRSQSTTTGKNATHS